MEKKYPNLDALETGQRIRCIMLMKGMTPIDIQEFMGYGSVQAVYHWFNGRRLPSAPAFYALSELFDVPVDMLMCGNKNNVPSAKYDNRGMRLLMYEAKLKLAFAG